MTIIGFSLKFSQYRGLKVTGRNPLSSNSYEYKPHDDPNVMSFIFGDESNAMDLKFTRINR